MRLLVPMKSVAALGVAADLWKGWEEESLGGGLFRRGQPRD